MEKKLWSNAEVVELGVEKTQEAEPAMLFDTVCNVCGVVTYSYKAKKCSRCGSENVRHEIVGGVNCPGTPAITPEHDDNKPSLFPTVS